MVENDDKANKYERYFMNSIGLAPKKKFLDSFKYN